MLSLSCIIAAGVALSNHASASDDLDNKRTLSGGLVVFVGVVTMIVEAVFIALRFANVGILNYKIKWFLIIVS